MFRHWIDCDKCHGDGQVLAIGLYGIDPLDRGTIPIVEDPNPATMVCPKCNGAKRFPFGYQETNPTGYP